MRSRVLLLASLGFPWFVHAAAVLLSALGARPLAGRGVALAICAGACAATALLARRASRNIDSERDLGATLRLPAITRLTLGALFYGGIAAFAICTVLALVLPIVAYDALAYRVPVIAQWLEAGTIDWVTSDDPVRNGYPLGLEAVSAVVAAATGSLELADVTGLAYVASGALGVGLLLLECGIRRELARAAAGTFLLVPMVILNAGSGYVDAAFAGATVALLCCAALLASQTKVDAELAIATGMAAAHVLALKGTGLGFVLLIVVGVAFYRRKLSVRAQPWRGFALALAFATPGLFWALRDLFQTGNPLWPVEIRLAGRTLLSGTGVMADILDVKHNTPADLARMTPFSRVLHTWLEWRGPAAVFDDRRAGLGWAWPFCALPAIAALGWQALRGRALRGVRELGFVLALTIACFALQPMNWWSRYTIWVWGIGTLALAFGAEQWLRRSRFRLLSLSAVVLTALCLTEAAVALPHANGAGVALKRWWAEEPHSLARLSDPRRALNAVYWVPDDFWRLGLDSERDVCRGAWKAGSDDAIVDGVFAQLSPRPRVHIVPDDDGDWPRVRRAWHASGCSALMLLRGSSVLPAAARDASVAVEQAHAFDPFYVVRENNLAAYHRHALDPSARARFARGYAVPRN
jgi:hypothetical protein